MKEAARTGNLTIIFLFLLFIALLLTIGTHKFKKGRRSGILQFGRVQISLHYVLPVILIVLLLTLFNKLFLALAFLLLLFTLLALG